MASIASTNHMLPSMQLLDFGAHMSNTIIQQNLFVQT